MSKVIGKVAQIIGPVVDVVFNGKDVELPKIYDSLEITKKDGTKLVRVELNDILYIEGLKDYVTIHTKQQKITSLQRMKALEEQLPSDMFIRIHNSFIVSLKAIEVVHKGDVQVGGNLLPIGETFKKSFREFIEKNQM